MRGFGVWAWEFLRRNPGYRRAWRRRAPLPGLPEPARFPVRWQTAVDRKALRWGLLAWEDPFADDGLLSPFWADMPVLEGVVRPGGVPFAVLAAAGKATVAGLRLGDGELILGVALAGAAVQVRLPGDMALPEDDGLGLVRDVAVLEDLWIPPSAPRRRRGAGTTSF